MRTTFASLIVALTLPGLAASAETGSISVSGQGHVSVVPDMARINLGVLTNAATANDAVEDMSDRLDGILASLMDAGISETDIQTSALRVNPIQDYNSVTGRSRITGYQAQSTLSVTVSDLDDLGRVLDQALSDGANQLNGLQFDVADRAPHEDAARRLAVADAMSKAGVLSDAAGVNLGALLSMAEGGAQAGPIRMEMSLARDAGVPVAAGDISISATVSMTYAIEN